MFKQCLRLTLFAFAVPANHYAHKAFFNSPARNKLAHRHFFVQQAANSSIEDRHDCVQFQEGFAVAVYDGHGGWQLAQYAKKELLKKFKQKIVSKDLPSSLEAAFDHVQNSYLELVKTTYELGFQRTAKIGSCALVAVVSNNQIYSANAGDSSGIIVGSKDGKPIFRKINHRLNASNKVQQARLKQTFPDEPDIYLCKGINNDACYVKGRLQPTRSLGDYHLKYFDFNNPLKRTRGQGFSSALSVFKGNYITHKPQIQRFELQPTDRYLILGSDGLWDELSKEQVASTALKSQRQKLAQNLLGEVEAKVMKRTGYTKEQLMKVPLGKRRNVMDDVTIVVVDLKDQFKK